MNATLDVLRVSSHTLGSMLLRPSRHSSRSWSTEYTFRLAKRLLQESCDQPIPWLRERQKLLTLYTPEMRKVSRYMSRIGGVPCITLKPSHLSDKRRTIIYIHGGGYCVGSAKGYVSTMAKIAVKSQCTVIGIDYRLCPEHAIPAAQEDCVKVTESLINQDSDTQFILMGDSAGGGLCLETMKALGNAGLEKRITACVLISPWLEPIDSAVLASQNASSDILDNTITEHWRDNFYTSPEQSDFLSLGDIDLGILPKLYIQAAGAEVFIDQINKFVERLQHINHPYHYDEFPGQFHVFQTFAPLVKEADAALTKIADFVGAL